MWTNVCASLPLFQAEWTVKPWFVSIGYKGVATCCYRIQQTVDAFVCKNINFANFKVSHVYEKDKIEFRF